MLVIDRADGIQSHDLYDRLAANSAFSLSRADAPPDEDDMRRLLRGSANAFAIEIAGDYETRIAELSTENTSPLVRVTAAADTGKQTELIFVAALQGAVERQRARLLMTRIGYLAPEGEEAASARRIAVSYAYAPTGGQAPTAVQQNVPAWLVFALFFVAVPFSNSFIRERQVGAQKRLRTTNIGALSQFFGKLAPYFVINQLQVVLMLAAGVYLVPLLGGQALQLNDDFGALAGAFGRAQLGRVGVCPIDCGNGAHHGAGDVDGRAWEYRAGGYRRGHGAEIRHAGGSSADRRLVANVLGCRRVSGVVSTRGWGREHLA